MGPRRARRMIPIPRWSDGATTMTCRRDTGRRRRGAGERRGRRPSRAHCRGRHCAAGEEEGPRTAEGARAWIVRWPSLSRRALGSIHGSAPDAAASTAPAFGPRSRLLLPDLEHAGDGDVAIVEDGDLASYGEPNRRCPSFRWTARWRVRWRPGGRRGRQPGRRVFRHGPPSARPGTARGAVAPQRPGI